MTANEILETVALPQTMLGHNLAVAAALTEAYRSGMYDGICGLNEYMRQYGGVEECPGPLK